MSNEAIHELIEQAVAERMAETHTTDEVTISKPVNRTKRATTKPVKMSPGATELLARGSDGIDPSDFVVEYVSTPENRQKRDKRTGQVIQYSGVHTVFGGLTRDFMAMYPTWTVAELYKLTDSMSEEGLVVKKPVKGGYMLFPADSERPAKAAASKISPNLARLLERFAKA